MKLNLEAFNNYGHYSHLMIVINFLQFNTTPKVEN